MTAKGGITNGKSHKEGGIPMVVKSTGQKVELEGGEGVINKRNMASEKTYEFNGEKMTTCEIASEINQANGNGVQIDCDDIVGKKYAYENGGVVFINYKENEIMYEPIDKKYWANDMEFDTIEDAQQFLDSGEIPEHIRGAYEKGLFNGGGNVYEKENNRYWKPINQATLSFYNLTQNSSLQEIDYDDTFLNGKVWIAFKKLPNGVTQIPYEVKMLIKEDFEYYSYGANGSFIKVSLIEGSWFSMYIDFENLTFKQLEEMLLQLPLQVEERLEDKNIKGYGELGFYDYGQYIELEISNTFSNGGSVDEQTYIDLFEDYENIPAEVQMILDEYSESFEDGDYIGLSKAQNELEQIGYTFDFYVDGDAYGLRPMNVKLSQLQGYEDEDEYARGGRMPNTKPIGTSLEDLHTATMSMGGYEEASDVSMTEFKDGGEVERATKHEMEHSDTINKIKRNDISTKDVARTIAKDHLKKDKNYYKKLDILESSTLAEIISNHEKNLHKKQNRKKYELGGGTEYTPHLVHIIFEDNHKSDIYTNEGKFDGEIIFKKDMLYNMEFLNNRGQETALQFPLSNKYVIIPNELISIKGYDRKYAGGGGVPSPYQSYRGRLSDNDIEILDLMRSEFRLSEDNNHFTIKQKESLSTFKGDNVVNQLSTEIISKLYGLMFKNHNAENPIQKLWIKNVGIGTLLNLAPIYLKEIVITHSENTFMQIEESILGILNEAGYKKQWKLADIDSMTKADSIMYCYPTTNPMGDSLSNLVRNANKNSTGIGIAEFTSENFFKSFVDDIKQNNNIYKSHLVNYYKINNGITENAKVTLIYTITKI